MAKEYGSSAVAERGGAMTRGQGWRTIRQRTAAFRSMAQAARVLVAGFVLIVSCFAVLLFGEW